MIEFQRAGTVISTTPTERGENTMVSGTYRNRHGLNKMKRNETMRTKRIKKKKCGVCEGYGYSRKRMFACSVSVRVRT